MRGPRGLRCCLTGLSRLTALHQLPEPLICLTHLRFVVCTPPACTDRCRLEFHHVQGGMATPAALRIR